MQHIFLTGEIGVGKSTLLGSLLRLFPGELAGFYTKKEAIDADGIASTYIHSPGRERSYGADNCVGTSSGNTRTGNVEVFETRGLAMLSELPEDCVIIMDELGVMESKAPRFCERVLELLEGDRRILGVVKPKHTEFLDAVRQHPSVRLFEVTELNRDEIYTEIKCLLDRSEL